LRKPQPTLRRLHLKLQAKSGGRQGFAAFELTMLPWLRRFAHSQAQQIVDFAGFLC
jgi:hypothetical protein